MSMEAWYYSLLVIVNGDPIGTHLLEHSPLQRFIAGFRVVVGLKSGNQFLQGRVKPLDRAAAEVTVST